MKITVITACYNSEKYIRQTMESVLTQSYRNVEYIVVDGGSTDNTVNIIQSFEPRFGGRMKWISEPDKGIYDAMNKGIAMVSGDIVGLLNSDDFYAGNGILEKVVKRFATSSCQAVYGDLVYVDPEHTSKIQRYWKSGRYTKNAFAYGWMPPHPSFFVKKEVYQRYGGFNTQLRSAADYEFMLRVIHKEGINLAYLPEILVCMRAGGMSNKNFKNRLRGNNEDNKAWIINQLQPPPLLRILKPLRKVHQYIIRKKCILMLGLLLVFANALYGQAGNPDSLIKTAGIKVSNANTSVYINNKKIIFVTDTTAAIAPEIYFVHVIPAGNKNLSEERRIAGYDILDFNYGDYEISTNDPDFTRCRIFIRDLPDYPIYKIAIGASRSGNEVWRETITLAGSPALKGTIDHISKYSLLYIAIILLLPLSVLLYRHRKEFLKTPSKE